MRPFKKIYNAVFTHYGRLNVLYRWRKWKLDTLTRFRHGQPTLFRLRDGRRFVVHPHDVLSLDIYLNRQYEPLETRFAKAILDENDTAVDVGANVGYFSALFSHCVAPRGKVYAFEPGPKTFNKLSATIRLMGLMNVVPTQAAVGARPGVCEFVSSVSGHDAQQSLREWDGLTGSKQNVPTRMISLDDFCGEHELVGRISLLKCDVEGFELHVLRGASAVLGCDHPPVLMVEINRSALEANGTRVEELTGMLENHQVFFTPLGSGEERAQVWDGRPEAFPELSNVFAFPRSGRFADRLERPEVRACLSLAGH